MTQNGFGANIELLCGYRDTAKIAQKILGSTIKTVRLDKEDNALYFVMADGYHVKLFDNGQSCCERRYMVCDDDLSYYDGATLMELKLKNAPEEEDKSGECHEVQFLEVTTARGSFSVANHNEHNGYYGGFAIELEEVKP